MNTNIYQKDKNVLLKLKVKKKKNKIYLYKKNSHLEY